MSKSEGVFRQIEELVEGAYKKPVDLFLGKPKRLSKKVLAYMSEKERHKKQKKCFNAVFAILGSVLAIVLGVCVGSPEFGIVVLVCFFVWFLNTARVAHGRHASKDR